MREIVKMVVVGGTLIVVGLLGLAWFVSTVLPEGTRQSDSGVTSAIQAPLSASDEGKAVVGGPGGP